MDNCDNCEDETPGIATYHCYVCDTNLCDACKVPSHSSKALRQHQMVAIADYHAFNDTYVPTIEDHRKDTQNVFISLDHDHQMLSPGSKFYNLNELQDELMPVVSFVGPTGVGKSTLMRHFCKEGCPKPLSSDPKSSDSTSADIHAYIGSFPTKRNPPTALMLDCEGINGTMPISIQATLKQFAHEQVERIMGLRKRYVNSAFPRLLYMFSSVFVFVFTGSAKEQQTWAGLTETYASQAAAATVNHLALPVLIVVFNKATATEGIWDIEEASARFRTMSRFNNLFSDVKVVYIPDRNFGARYVTQVQAFRDVVAASIDRQKLNTKAMAMQLFSLAIPEFSENPEAVFNFVDIALRNQPLPQDYAAYLTEFFLCVYNTGISKGLANQMAFDQASYRLIERLVDSFLHHMVRNYIAIPESIPEGLMSSIDQVEAAILEYLPCTATHEFPPLEEEVFCENILRDHGNVHQSSKTYTAEVPQAGLIAQLLGSKKTVKQSCRWEGGIQVPKRYLHQGWLGEAALAMKVPVTSSTFMDQHKMRLASQQHILVNLNTTRLCLACLLAIPTQFLQCKHKLCIACCKELQVDGNIECPFCNKVGQWQFVDIPKSAGYRILSIDGGGVRGIISAILLKRIEEKLDIPIAHLFDLIIGTSMGGLNAIGFGLLQLKGAAMVDSIQELSSKAFKAMLGISWLGQLFFGYKYARGPLHTALESLIKDAPMFSANPLPRVAVVACEVSAGKPRTVMFTSYNSPNTAIRREVRVSQLQAAEATTAAGTYFPVFNTDYGSFTDGSILCNNPCVLGYEEAKRLWGNKSLDYLLSIGTGTSPTKIVLEDGLFSFMNLAVEVAANAYAAWEDLQEIDGEAASYKKNKSARLNPLMNHDYAMDDFQNVPALIEIATEFIRDHTSELEEVCSMLLAKLFYVVLPDEQPKEELSIQLRTRVHIPQANAATQFGAFSFTMLIENVKRNFKPIFSVSDTGVTTIQFKGIPLKGNIELYVFSHIRSNGAIHEKLRNPPTISGCPLRISRDG